MELLQRLDALITANPKHKAVIAFAVARARKGHVDAQSEAITLLGEHLTMETGELSQIVALVQHANHDVAKDVDTLIRTTTLEPVTLCRFLSESLPAFSPNLRAEMLEKSSGDGRQALDIIRAACTGVEQVHVCCKVASQLISPETLAELIQTHYVRNGYICTRTGKLDTKGNCFVQRKQDQRTLTLYFERSPISYVIRVEDASAPS